MENTYERSLKALKNDHWSIFLEAMVFEQKCWGMVYLTKKNGKYYREGEVLYEHSDPLCPSYDVFSEEISEGDTSEDIRRLIKADRKGQLAELVRQKNYLVLDSPHFDLGEIKSLRIPEPLLRLLMEQYLKEPIPIKQKAAETPTLPQKKTEEKGSSSKAPESDRVNDLIDALTLELLECWSIFLEAIVLEQVCWGMVYLTKKDGKYYREGRVADMVQGKASGYEAFSTEISESNASKDIRQIIEADRRKELSELVCQKKLLIYYSPKYDFGELSSLQLPNALLTRIKEMYVKEQAQPKQTIGKKPTQPQQKTEEKPVLPQKKTEEKGASSQMKATACRNSQSDRGNPSSGTEQWSIFGEHWSIFLEATVLEQKCWGMVYLTKKNGKYYREGKTTDSAQSGSAHHDAFSSEISEDNTSEDIRQIIEADRKGRLAELVPEKGYLMFDSPSYDFGELESLRIPKTLLKQIKKMYPKGSAPIRQKAVEIPTPPKEPEKAPVQPHQDTKDAELLRIKALLPEHQLPSRKKTWFEINSKSNGASVPCNQFDCVYIVRHTSPHDDQDGGIFQNTTDYYLPASDAIICEDAEGISFYNPRDYDPRFPRKHTRHISVDTMYKELVRTAMLEEYPGQYPGKLIRVLETNISESRSGHLPVMNAEACFERYSVMQAKGTYVLHKLTVKGDRNSTSAKVSETVYPFATDDLNTITPYTYRKHKIDKEIYHKELTPVTQKTEERPVPPKQKIGENPVLPKQKTDVPPRDAGLHENATLNGKQTQPAPPAEAADQSSFVFSGTTLEKFTDKEFTGEVRVPSFVTTIGDSAFMHCKLSSAILPAACTFLGEYAFAGCRQLKKVEFSQSCERITLSSSAFASCVALEEINLPEVLLIRNPLASYGWFHNCSMLKKVTFHRKTSEIGEGMFKDCVSLVSVELPEELRSIHKNAFSGCTALKEVSMPGQVTKISDNAFENCSSLTQISIPGTVKAIQANAFSGCSKLQKLVIADGVAIIEDCAFKNCKLASVDLPPSVQRLGVDAFDRNTHVRGYKKRKVLFPNAPEDLIVAPIVGERLKPIYYPLFETKPLGSYSSASVVINLMNGNLYRIDSKPASYGIVTKSDDNVSGLTFSCLPELGSHTRYKDMTPDNWRTYIPREALEKAANNVYTKRSIDNSFTPKDHMGIDGLYIGLTQRYSKKAFYFRKTQTGYRLYCGRSSESYAMYYSFDKNDCTEEALYLRFIPLDRSPNTSFAGEERDIILSRREFYSIVKTVPDLFSGQYKGMVSTKQVPISIYGGDRLEAVLWKNGRSVPCADHPEIRKVYEVLRSFMEELKME